MAGHPIRPHLANRLCQRQSNPPGPALRRHARRLKINLPSLVLLTKPKKSSFRPERCLFFPPAPAVEKSASLPQSFHGHRAFALALQVFAVILNAVKDPEEFHSP